VAFHSMANRGGKDMMLTWQQDQSDKLSTDTSGFGKTVDRVDEPFRGDTSKSRHGTEQQNGEKEVDLDFRSEVFFIYVVWMNEHAVTVYRLAVWWRSMRVRELDAANVGLFVMTKR